MKVLFFCNGNVGRSQMAEAIFNSLSKRHTASSAGLEGGLRAGKPLGVKAPDVTKAMSEIGIDVSQKLPKQLTAEMVRDADMIVNIASEREIPDFVDRKKMIVWHVEDGKGKPYTVTVKIRDEIKKLVESLVKEIG